MRKSQITAGRVLSSAAAFSLVELLVTMLLMAGLIGLLLPGLQAARAQARAVCCGSNIRQVALANTLYSQEHCGLYCPGAPRFLKNLERWHGVRDDPAKPFDPARGPLVPYLGPSGRIRECPLSRKPMHGFEAGSGGYGYNLDFLGVQLQDLGSGYYRVLTDELGAAADHIGRPPQTLMFADAGFAADAGVIEYSFAHPRFQTVDPAARYDPSIHFRHRRQANVAWCDGHVEHLEITFSWSSGLYRQSARSFDIGWFGFADDNAYFDMRAGE